MRLFLARHLVVVLAFAPSAPAQQTANLQETRSLVVNVFDRHGLPVRDLTKSNFAVRLNSELVAVADAQYSLAPRRNVVLLDMSGSMTGVRSSEKWHIAREAVDDLLTQTPSDVTIAMLTFAGKVRDTFDFSQGRSAMLKWLNEGPGQQPRMKEEETRTALEARTALFDAVLQGLKSLQPVRPGDAIYAVTDGGENISQSTASETRAALLQSGVRLFTFVLADDVTRLGASIRYWLQLVDDTGGFTFGITGHHRPPPSGEERDVDYFYDKSTREKIKGYTQELNIQVNGFWTLQLVSAASDKPSKLKLEIVGHDGKTRNDVVVTYPRLVAVAK